MTRSRLLLPLVLCLFLALAAPASGKVQPLQQHQLGGAVG